MKLSTPRKLAFDLLPRSRCNVQVSAVLSDRHGHIFSWGWNFASADGKSTHAEQHAFKRANPTRLYRATLTVAARRRKSGAVIMARPCDMCWPLILKYGIQYIEYTNYNTWEKELNG